MALPPPPAGIETYLAEDLDEAREDTATYPFSLDVIEGPLMTGRHL